jgi:hypothetical protein
MIEKMGLILNLRCIIMRFNREKVHISTSNNEHDSEKQVTDPCGEGDEETGHRFGQCPP